MRVIVLGRPGTGKTTLVKLLVEHFPGFFRGFYTEEIRRGAQRFGFRIVTLSGKLGMLAAKEGNSSFRVGSYRVFVEEFERLVLPELEEALKRRIPIVVDEIGKMELYSLRFAELIETIWKEAPLVLATSCLPELPQVKELLRKGMTERLFLNQGNREEIFRVLLERVESLKKEGGTGPSSHRSTN
ncbi:MAG: nucleoside-triphosphatase [Candidatus Caldatribacteriaceae bacterium]